MVAAGHDEDEVKVGDACHGLDVFLMQVIFCCFERAERILCQARLCAVNEFGPPNAQNLVLVHPLVPLQTA